MPVPSARQPPHCSRLVCGSMHSNPAETLTLQAIWLAGHTSVERLRVRAPCDAAREQTSFSGLHQPVEERDAIACCQSKREGRRVGGRLTGSADVAVAARVAVRNSCSRHGGALLRGRVARLAHALLIRQRDRRLGQAVRARRIGATAHAVGTAEEEGLAVVVGRAGVAEVTGALAVRTARA